MLRAQRDRKYRSRSHTFGRAFTLGIVVAMLCTVFAPAFADDPPPNDPPEIEWFAISDGPGNLYEFYGYVSDPDGSTDGYIVTFSGVVSGISVAVGPDGSFDEVFHLTDVQSGLVLADTADPQGASAETVAFDLYVIQ